MCCGWKSCIVIHMITQPCRKCSVEKPLEEFHFKNKKLGKRRKICKPCWSVYHKQHYEANKQRYLEKAVRRKRALQAEVWAYKESHSCKDCDESYAHYVMDFDHVRGEKIENVSAMARMGSTQKVWDEIKKCELVCSNCHRERTHQRR